MIEITKGITYLNSKLTKRYLIQNLKRISRQEFLSLQGL